VFKADIYCQTQTDVFWIANVDVSVRGGMWVLARGAVSQWVHARTSTECMPTTASTRQSRSGWWFYGIARGFYTELRAKRSAGRGRCSSRQQDQAAKIRERCAWGQVRMRCGPSGAMPSAPACIKARVHGAISIEHSEFSEISW
jgi:hypothetical protein